jgi:hypothetical protein
LPCSQDLYARPECVLFARPDSDEYLMAIHGDQTRNDSYPQGRDQVLDNNHPRTWSLCPDLQGQHRQE